MHLKVQMETNKKGNGDESLANKKIGINQIERKVSAVPDDSAVWRWKKKKIELVYPPFKIDGKSICLEMGKPNKANLFPFKLQKCDRTVERGNFGCTGDIDFNLSMGIMGTAWNAKRRD